ncbi:electron transfer flavoprotein subunit beta [Neptuniibacter halophilus]|uniref:electron transfer flavoprotein subunit beta n=1 Tax=Neptuniibacter halophilus TaxID=651666 RepID=UPI0025747E2F|nr:electron transfer flavoprotein subunit beta [Neptuniibacter halophilus]
MQPDNANLNIVSLVSVGRHPQSGRQRRAEQDARAVELGMTLNAERLTVLHAGDPQEPSLRSYAGVGLSAMQVLKIGAKDDAVISIADYLQGNKPDILLTGVRAESGESSGMMPYLLAEKLGWPVVPRIADIVSVEKGVAEVLLALPRGQRRALKVALPFVASVDNAAPEARQSAYGPGMRAEIKAQTVAAVADTARSEWIEAPAKPKPKRLKVVKAKTAADRFKAATAKPQGASGKVVKEGSAREMAQEIFNLLLEEKVIK